MLPSFVRAPFLFDNRDTRAGPELADGRWKIGMLVLHHEPENAAAHATTKTMKRLPLRIYMERRGLLLVKRAKRLEICARALQREIRTNHLNDVVGCGNLLDYF